MLFMFVVQTDQIHSTATVCHTGANCTLAIQRVRTAQFFGRRGAAMEHACVNGCVLHNWLYKGSHKLDEENDGANCTIEKLLVLRFFVALEKFTTIVNCSNYSDTQL